MVSQPIRLINLFGGRLPFFLFLRLSFIFLEVVFLVGSNKQKIFFLVVFHFIPYGLVVLHTFYSKLIQFTLTILAYQLHYFMQLASNNNLAMA